MIGNGYWSTGITVQYLDGRWGAEVKYLDDGFANDNPDDGRIATQGTLRTRYFVRDGEQMDALTAAIDAVKTDAERLGITWKGADGIGPFVYMEGDGENPDKPTPPEGWRALVDAQARRLGWEPLYASLSPSE